MHLLRTSGFALLAFAGMIGAASAAIHFTTPYSWPLQLSVPVTVSYPKAPAGFFVQLFCYVTAPATGGLVLGGAHYRLPVRFVSRPGGGRAFAQFNGTIRLFLTANIQGASQRPQPGYQIDCHLQARQKPPRGSSEFISETSAQLTLKPGLPSAIPIVLNMSQMSVTRP